MNQSHGGGKRFVATNGGGYASPSTNADPPQPQPARATQSAHKNLSAISKASKLPQLSQAGDAGSPADRSVGTIVSIKLGFAVAAVYDRRIGWKRRS
jgi:hypothetical protein